MYIQHVVPVVLLSNLYFPNRISVFFLSLNFYFMHTAKIPVYGHIALSVSNIEYTLRCLEYIYSVSLPFRHLIVKTLTNEL